MTIALASISLGSANLHDGFQVVFCDSQGSCGGTGLDDVRTYTGTLILDLILVGARNLKDRRGPLRALQQKLRNQDFAVAQVGPADLIQRVFLAVTVVSGTAGATEELLDKAERVVFASPFEVADVRRNVSSETFPSC